jgi:hypothetical protein
MGPSLRPEEQVGVQMSPAPRTRVGETQTESVRDRILSTARELFYKEGARSVGVDTVVAQSGVASRRTAGQAGTEPRRRATRSRAPACARI